MNHRILIFTFGLLFSCSSKETKKEGAHSIPMQDSNTKQIIIPNKSKERATIIPSDTTSSDFLIYLIKTEIPLNAHWTCKLDSLDIFAMPKDSTSRLSVIRDWKINDSISAVILSLSTGTGYDEYLITLRNKHDFVSNKHISDNADSDLSPDNPYFYTQYKLIDERRIKLFNHKIVGTEGGDEKDKLLSIQIFTIQNDGRVSKQ